MQEFAFSPLNAVPEVVVPLPPIPRTSSFAQVMEQLNVHAPLAALDVGTGSGTFCGSLAEHYPGTFRSVLGVDVMRATSPKPQMVGSTNVEIRFNTPYEAIWSDPSFAKSFDVVFFNCPSNHVWPECLDTVPRLLAPWGGLIVISQRQPAFGLEYYNAYDEPSDVAHFYHDYAKQSLRPRGYAVEVIDNLAGYPTGTQETVVAGIIVARPPGGR